MKYTVSLVLADTVSGMPWHVVDVKADASVGRFARPEAANAYAHKLNTEKQHDAE